MTKRDAVVILVLALALLALCLSTQVMFGLLDTPAWPGTQLEPGYILARFREAQPQIHAEKRTGNLSLFPGYPASQPDAGRENDPFNPFDWRKKSL